MARILYLYAQINREEGLHARRTRQLLSLIKRQGYAVDLLTLPGGDAWNPALIDRLYTTPRIPFVRGMALYGYGLRRIWATILVTLVAIRLVLHNHYDAIHCADRSIRIGKVLAWLFRTKLIFEWRSESGHDFTRWLKRRSRAFKSTVTLVITDEEQPTERLRDAGILGKLATIPLLPDADILRTLPLFSQTNGQQNTFRLTAFSYTATLEDLGILWDLLPTLLTEQPKLRLSIVGGSPRAIERKRKALAKLAPEVMTAIDFHGNLQGAAEWNTHFMLSDVLLLPTVHGSQPTPLLLDAMAAQRAIIAIHCPAYERLLTPDCATFIPPERHALRAVIQWYIAHPSATAERAIAAARQLDTERDLTMIAENFRACYSYALERASYE